MRTEGREPVLVENKYTSAAPALLVSQCEKRLSQRWANGRPVAVVVGYAPRPASRLCLTLPWLTLSSRPTISSGRHGHSDGPDLPQGGWLSGPVNELAASVDRAGEDAAQLSGSVNEVRETLSAAALQIKNHPNSDTISEGFGDVLYQAGGSRRIGWRWR